jgi:ubiquinone/menaquinone biosynthesis C-methylase UbiE
MNQLNKLRKYLSASLNSLYELEPELAYDKWSLNYDTQPGNLMLDLDEVLFIELIENVDFHNKIIVDVGCGTGRHWKKIYDKNLARMIGFDVSAGMLKVLKDKFPEAETHLLKANHLETLGDASCDLIISTLAIAHIKNIENAFIEWDRVLKSGGQIIITDYHPEALSKGGNRTFMYNGKKIAVRNHIHPIEKLREIFGKLKYKIVDFKEKKIDESVKHYYNEQNALKVYERFTGTPIIYGIHLIKNNEAE